MSNGRGPRPDVSTRLGYLLKHAQQRMTQLYAQALAPYGIDVRELGVLMLLAGHEPASQQHAAHRSGVDRTTMVTVLDALQAKGLVSRRPDAQDRRRKVVELTAAGHDLLLAAGRASGDAERALLAPLDPQDAQHLRDALQSILTHRVPADTDAGERRAAAGQRPGSGPAGPSGGARAVVQQVATTSCAQVAARARMWCRLRRDQPRPPRRAPGAGAHAMTSVIALVTMPPFQREPRSTEHLRLGAESSADTEGLSLDSFPNVAASEMVLPPTPEA